MGQDRRGVAAIDEAGEWIDRLPAPAAVLTRHGTVVRYNDEAGALFGWSGSAPIPFIGRDESWFTRTVRQTEEEGRATTVVSRRLGNSRIAVELRCRRLDDDRLLVLFHDCTTQVLASRTRRSGEHHLRRYLDRLPEPVVIEQSGRIAYTNPAAAHLFDRPAKSLSNRPTEDVLPAQLLRRLRATQPSARHPAELEADVEFGGRRHMLQLAGLPLLFDGTPALALLVHDVTQHRQAERRLEASSERLRRSEEQLRQAQKMDAIGRLAAGIAHDFNNLLTAMQGHVQFVLEDLPEESPVRDDVLEIRRVADRATELTRQLLTFARKQPHRPQPLDMNDVVRDTERLLRRLLRADIALDLALADDLPSAFADRGQIEQVLVNLVVNARDAMADGGTIVIRTAAVRFDESDAAPGLELAPGPYVQLTVSDSGSGMSRDVQSRMFEPFFTTKEQGTGLGLPTVYGIVKQSGGHISVYSEPGLGTTIKAFLPAAESQPAAPTRPAATAEVTGRSADLHDTSHPATVLLVEDDPGIRALAERTLRSRGFHVLAAASGQEALELAGAEQELDVVVTDLMMPEMSGDQLARQIGASHPAAQIILMSGFPEDVLAETDAAAPHRFLEKPFTQQQLLEAVDDALRR